MKLLISLVLFLAKNANKRILKLIYYPMKKAFFEKKKAFININGLFTLF